MDEIQYQQHYYGEWKPPDWRAVKALLLYHVRCESFDRMVCEARDDYGNAIPFYPSERRSVRNYHEYQRKILRAKLGHGWLDRYKHERKLVQQMTYSRQVRELDRIIQQEQL